MITTIMKKTPDLRLRGGDMGQSYQDHVELVGVAYEAVRTPDFHDCDRLYDALAQASAMFTGGLLDNDYKMWLFLNGAPLSADRRMRLKTYDLSGRARNAELITDSKLENTFKCGDLTRTAGVYLLESDRFPCVLKFVTTIPGSLLIFSRRNDFLTDETLSQAYGAATSDIAINSLEAMNWERLSFLLCPKSDVIVKTWLGDLYRNMLFALSPDTLLRVGEPLKQ